MVTRARKSSGRWHGVVGKNVSQLEHCQTHHSETGTKCSDFCLDLEENGLFCNLWFLKQQYLLLLLLINRRLQLQLVVKLHAFSATELEYCSSGMVVAKKNIFEYSLECLGVYSGTSLHCCAQPYYFVSYFILKTIYESMQMVDYIGPRYKCMWMDSWGKWTITKHSGPIAEQILNTLKKFRLGWWGVITPRRKKGNLEKYEITYILN